MNTIAVVSAVCLIALIHVNAAYGDIDWWNEDFTYGKKVTINSTLVNGTHTNFPILVNVTDIDLMNNAASDGLDIAFTNLDNLTQYDHEIEYYDSTTGYLVAWVNIPEVLNNTDTQFMMYYGDTGNNGQQNNTNAVWTDYHAVWHFTNNYDSTGNNGWATNNGATLTFDGMAGGTYLFDGVNDFLNITGTDYLDDKLLLRYATTGWSIQQWVWWDLANIGTDKIWSKKDGTSGNEIGLYYEYRGSPPTVDTRICYVRAASDGTPSGILQCTQQDDWTSSNGLGKWQSLVMFFEGLTVQPPNSNSDYNRDDLGNWMNGTCNSDGRKDPCSQGSSGMAGNPFWNNTRNFNIGALQGGTGSGGHDGYMEEFRIAKFVMDESRHDTEYNYLHPDTGDQFLSFGSEGQDPQTVFDTIVLRVNSPADDRLGGVYSTQCNEGYSIRAILPNGTAVCQPETFILTQISSHAVADGQYWGYGISSDTTNANARQSQISTNVTITDMSFNQEDFHNCDGDVRWELWKMNNDTATPHYTGFGIIVGNTTTDWESKHARNQTGVFFEAGSSLLHKLTFLDATVCTSATVRGFGVAGYGTADHPPTETGETNTAISLGDFDVFKQKVDKEFEFRGLKAGSNITLTQDGTDITINSVGTPGPPGPAGGGGNSTVDYIIRKIGSNYVAINGSTQVADISSTSWSTVCQYAHDKLPGPLGGIIGIRPGIYTVDDTCYITRAHASIIGGGVQNTQLKLDNGVNKNIFEVNSTGANLFAFLNLNGNNATNTAGSGIVFDDTPTTGYSNSILQGVRARNFADNGFEFKATNNNFYNGQHQIFYSYGLLNEKNGILIESEVDDSTIVGGEYGSNGEDGLHSNADAWIIVGVNLWGNVDNNIHFESESGRNRVSASRMDDAHSHSVYLNGVEDTLFVGNHLFRNSFNVPNTADSFFITGASKNVQINDNQIGHTSAEEIVESQRHCATVEGTSTAIYFHGNQCVKPNTGDWNITTSGDVTISSYYSTGGAGGQEQRRSPIMFNDTAGVTVEIEQLDDTLRVKVPEDSSSAGLSVYNNDGFVKMGNINGTAGSFGAFIQADSEGKSNAFRIISETDPDNDKGETPFFLVEAQQNDNTDVTTRPLFAIRNNANIPAFLLEFNGTLAGSFGCSEGEQLVYDSSSDHWDCQTAMRGVFSYHIPSGKSAGSDAYTALVGSSTWFATESGRSTIAHDSFTLKNAYIDVTSNSLNTIVDMTLRLNGADTGIVITITASTTGEYSDTANSVDVVAGDNLSWEIGTSAAGSGSIEIRSATIGIY